MTADPSPPTPERSFVIGEHVMIFAEIAGMTPSGEMAVLVEDARTPGGRIAVNVDPKNMMRIPAPEYADD